MAPLYTMGMEKSRCKHEVLIPGMNFSRYRQCKNTAKTGSDFCSGHQAKDPKAVDLAEMRAKTNLYIARLIAKRRRQG